MVPAAQAMIPLASVERACERLGRRLQSLSPEGCLQAGFGAPQGASRQGFPLLARDYAPRSRREIPPRVLLIGGIHGDELSSVSVVFQWMRKLETERVQPFHWRVIPCANPDGLLARPATRTNGAGVDLNRNFPSANWTAEALDYWQRRTGSDPRRYPGPGPLSEPESRWLMQQIEQFQPDAIVSVHAPYGLLDFDGPLAPPERFGFLRLHPLGTYPGSLGNFAGLNRQIPVITLELPHAGLMPTASQSLRIWIDMLAWLEQRLPREEPPLYLRLRDSAWLD
ncbi:MAG TPA: M14 family murein peptide amidase A [Nevskiaceae bacterium]|nr:M14 family murein peptide amidase A [Nevskiaceae bacterium]